MLRLSPLAHSAAAGGLAGEPQAHLSPVSGGRAVEPPNAAKRKRAWPYRQGRPEVGGPNEVWAMDFMADQLFDGAPSGS
jgi:hypothetical protein